MTRKRKLYVSLYMVLAGLLVFTLLHSRLPTDTAVAETPQAKTGRHPIKYVFSVDYPIGRKAEYHAWVKTVADDLSAPSQLRRITSYDNYYGASPNRFVELEFDSMEDAAKYFQHEKVRAVFDAWTNYGVNMKVHVLLSRSDYAR